MDGERAGRLATVGMIAGSAATCWTVILAAVGLIGWRPAVLALASWLSWTAMWDTGPCTVTRRGLAVAGLWGLAVLTLPHLTP